jgi:HTH-type transcriptional regulator/antitoxin HipB
MNDSFELKKMKTVPIRKVKSFDELLDLKYGVVGIIERDVHETKANNFVISEILKEARKESNFIQ